MNPWLSLNVCTNFKHSVRYFITETGQLHIEILLPPFEDSASGDYQCIYRNDCLEMLEDKSIHKQHCQNNCQTSDMVGIKGWFQNFKHWILTTVKSFFLIHPFPLWEASLFLSWFGTGLSARLLRALSLIVCANIWAKWMSAGWMLEILRRDWEKPDGTKWLIKTTQRQERKTSRWQLTWEVNGDLFLRCLFVIDHSLSAHNKCDEANLFFVFVVQFNKRTVNEVIHSVLF